MIYIVDTHTHMYKNYTCVEEKRCISIEINCKNYKNKLYIRNSEKETCFCDYSHPHLFCMSVFGYIVFIENKVSLIYICFLEICTSYNNCIRYKANRFLCDIYIYMRLVYTQLEEIYFFLPALCMFFGRPNSELMSSELRLG